MNAPVGLTKAQDENTKKQMLEKVNAVIPEKKLQNALKRKFNITYKIILFKINYR